MTAPGRPARMAPAISKILLTSALFISVLSAVGSGAGPARAGTVMDRVTQQGEVRCGVDLTPGFSGVDSDGNARGFEVDACRALAAAVLGSPDAVSIRRINTANKFDALVAGDIDVAFGMATWTYGRDTGLGTVFPMVLFYDGQGFMAWRDRDGKNLTWEDAPAGTRVCVQRGTTSEANLAAAVQNGHAPVQMVTTASSEDKFIAFARRQCTLVTGDRSELAARAATMPAERGQWRILPDVISREPLGPAVAQGDPLWFSVVRWVILSMMVAEAKGVTSANVAGLTTSPDLEIRRLAGGDPTFGKPLGLDSQWALRVISQIGNYGEVFRRNLGDGSPLGLDRGANALWTEGGLHYAPPLR